MRETLLALVAFVPVMVCTGYLACWFANLFGFRRQSLIERLLWSIPSSIAISTIASVAITWLISLTAAVWFFFACGFLWLLAYISYFGYRHLNASIPLNAVVQFNPSYHNEYWTVVQLIGVDHQIAIGSDRSLCGATLGGDPSGCLAMGPPIAVLYKEGTAQNARSVCRAFGIQFLVATIYDPVWNDRNGWVWQLPPVVQDPEFRALDCRDRSQPTPRLPNNEPRQSNHPLV